MSRTAAVAWLVIALVLGAAAFLLLRSPPHAAPAKGLILDLVPARITELAVTPPGGPTRRVVRNPLTAEWSLVEASGAAWPVHPTNVQAALRLLTSLEGRPVPEATPAPASEEARVRLRLDDGSEWSIFLAERSLGGERRARIVPPGGPARDALVDAAIFEALITTGPGEWRTPLALGDAPATASRIILTTPRGRIVLGRTAGRWALQEPVSAPADERAVARLTRELAGIRVARFLDGDPPETAGLDRPLSRARLETDRPDPSGASTAVEVRTLTVGAPADISEKTLYGRIDRAILRPGSPEEPAPPAFVAIGRQSMEGIAMDAAAYLTPAAVAVPPAEVGAAVITTEDGVRRLERTVDGWRLDGEPAAPGASISDRADSLLKLACQQEAAERLIGGAPGTVLATVRLESVSGGTLAECAVGLTEPPGPSGPGSVPARVFLASGQVVRLYDAAPWADLLAWLAAPPG